MSKTKEPDRLSRHSSEALAMGMSYGKYMALRHDLGFDRRSESIEMEEPGSEEPLVTGKCKVCGRILPLNTKGGRPRKYCSEVCAGEARLEMNRVAVERYRACKYEPKQRKQSFS